MDLLCAIPFQLKQASIGKVTISLENTKHTNKTYQVYHLRFNAIRRIYSHHAAILTEVVVTLLQLVCWQFLSNHPSFKWQWMCTQRNLQNRSGTFESQFIMPVDNFPTTAHCPAYIGKTQSDVSVWLLDKRFGWSSHQLRCAGEHNAEEATHRWETIIL